MSSQFLIHFSVVSIDPLFSALGKEIGGVVISQVVPKCWYSIDQRPIKRSVGETAKLKLRKYRGVCVFTIAFL
jgi:hypothetical protein